MSLSVPVSFIRQYEREVHLEYQRKGSLIRGTIRTQTGISGESTTFQIISSGTAGTKTRHGQVPVMNLVHTNVTATLEDRYAADYIDKLDLLKLNIDERQAIVSSGAMALGRATDEIILAAMDDATNTTTVTVTTGATIRNSILNAVRALMERDVPWDGDVWGAISPAMHAQFLTVPEYKDADFIGMDDLPFKGWKQKIRSWLGVSWYMHSGLPLASTTRTGFIYHKQSVGHAIGADVQTMVDWVPERAAWLANSMMSMGAVLIDNDGVQELTLDESLALATT
jgi:hypothetical protein